MSIEYARIRNPLCSIYASIRSGNDNNIGSYETCLVTNKNLSKWQDTSHNMIQAVKERAN